jgi:RNA recognition motif-containing protein
MKKPKLPNKTLRVENISDNTSPKDLRELFSEYGTVFGVEIRLESSGDVSASLVMAQDAAEEAIDGLDDQDWRGQWLKVEEEQISWDNE